MSMTGADTLFAAIHETALNDLIRAFFNARPRHLHYGSSMFVGSTTVSETNMPPIQFPGVPGGIHWAVDFRTPQVDLFDDDSGGSMPPELSLNVGRLTLTTNVAIRMLCGSARDLGNDNDDQKGQEEDGKLPHLHVAGTELDVWALCHPVARPVSGPAELSIVVDQVEIVDIAPAGLEELLECLIRTLLQAVLSDMWLPIPALRAGAFSASITRGPEIDADQAMVWGAV